MYAFELNLKLTKRADVTIVMSDKINFRMWNITMEKESSHDNKEDISPRTQNSLHPAV